MQMQDGGSGLVTPTLLPLLDPYNRKVRVTVCAYARVRVYLRSVYVCMGMCLYLCLECVYVCVCVCLCACACMCVYLSFPLYLTI
jgi:hypothetical protein